MLLMFIVEDIISLSILNFLFYLSYRLFYLTKLKEENVPLKSRTFIIITVCVIIFTTFISMDGYAGEVNHQEFFWSKVFLADFMIVCFIVYVTLPKDDPYPTNSTQLPVSQKMVLVTSMVFMAFVMFAIIKPILPPIGNFEYLNKHFTSNTANHEKPIYEDE